ncbi:MAG: hypothetical protein MJ252_22330 [archaeon]|nr:hypothetical protein [archaeon]
MGIGDWGLGPIPNPQSPIPNPQFLNIILLIFSYLIYFYYIIKLIFIFLFAKVNIGKWKILNIQMKK